MEIHAEALQSLRARTSEKWRAYPDDVLPLFVAEMDFPMAAPIAEALGAAIRRSDTGYLGPGRHLADAFAAFGERRWAWRIDPAQVSTTTDVSVAIVETLRQAIAPGDPVVLTPPVYPPFFDLIPESGGVVREVPLLRSGDRWSLDLPGIETAFAAGARALLLCNPHNPLGHVHPAEELAALADLAAGYRATIISDEVHATLTYPDAQFTPFLSVSDAARESGVCVTSASKGWNLAGLKCAMMVTASERGRRLLGGLPVEVHVRTSIFGYLATVAAYSEGESWLDAVIGRLDENRHLLGRLLAEHLPEVAYRMPQASYLAWLDFRALDWGDDPSRKALREARVALNPGPEFGTQGRGFTRLNFGCSPEVLTEAVTRLAAIR